MRYALLILLIASSAAGDVFRVLEDPHDAAQARVDLIQQATSEIDAVYFLARNDRIALTALALLRDTHRRGVATVRLIVDVNFLHIPKAVLANLQEEGVQIRVYHPLTVHHPLWLFTRMHEKLIIVDGQRYITGGRNLGESYFGMARMNYIGFVQLNTGTDWSAGRRDVAAVHFLHDPLASEEGPRVGARLADMIAGAQKSIVIESPYLVPSKSLLELLARKVAEGVSVQIVTNSLRSGDGVLAQAAYLKYRRRVARAGIDSREFKGPDSLHAKSVVIDGRIVLVGSYNVDPRSQNLKTEVMSMADDPETARELLNLIDVHIANAWRVGVDGRGPREEFPGARAKSFRAWAARFLLPVIEGQL